MGSGDCGAGGARADAAPCGTSDCDCACGHTGGDGLAAVPLRPGQLCVLLSHMGKWLSGHGDLPAPSSADAKERAVDAMDAAVCALYGLSAAEARACMADCSHGTNRLGQSS